jgi:hypothetical protein
MKSMLFILLTFVSMNLFGFQSAKDTNIVSIKPKIEIKDTTIAKKYLDSLDKKSLKLDSLNAEINKLCPGNCYNREGLKFWHWLLVFLPTGIMLFFSWLLISKLSKDSDFKLINLFAIDDGKNIYSTSRFIVFLTGLAAIFICTTLTMYYGYVVVAECKNNPSIEGLWKIFIGLGLGVVPYGINVWHKNEKEENANPTVPTNPTQQSSSSSTTTP